MEPDCELLLHSHPHPYFLVPSINRQQWLRRPSLDLGQRRRVVILFWCGRSCSTTRGNGGMAWPNPQCAGSGGCLDDWAETSVFDYCKSLIFLPLVTRDYLCWYLVRARCRWLVWGLPHGGSSWIIHTLLIKNLDIVITSWTWSLWT